MKKTVSKSMIFKLIIIVLSVLLIASAVTAVALGVKYYKSNEEIARMNEELSKEKSLLDEQISANESLKEQNSSEVESYENKLNQQSSEHQSAVDELNKKIKDLNKQLAAKKATSTTKASSSGGVPVMTTPTPTPSTGKTVYLTFDDGPSSYTPQVLDVLDKYGVKATFFVKNGGSYNYVMKEIVDRGHQIALHTYSHDYAKIYSSDEAYFNDLQKISNLVYEQTGVTANVLRFPGGSSNTVSKKYSKGIMSRLTDSVVEKGYVYFDWNCTNGDADGANTVQKQLNYCSQYPKSASRIVVLMHDTKKVTLESLPKIIEYYQSCGMQFGVLTPAVPPIHHNVLN